MASKRLDVCVPRKKSDGGTWWLKIGTAWENEKGTQVVLDALPIPDAEGRCAFNLFEPKPREDQRQERRQAGAGHDDWGSDWSDER